MSGPPPRRAAWRLIPSLVLVAAGVALAISVRSRPALLIGFTALVIGKIAFFRSLLFAGPTDGWLYRRRRAIAVALGSTALFLAIAFAAAASIRLGPVGGRKDDNSRFDPELGWVSVDGDDTVGQRGDKIDRSREHIAVAGDSVMYGWGLEADQTAAHFLGQRFKDVQVLNLSVSGYAIDQYYLYLKRTLPRLRPRLVIVGVYAGNDFEKSVRDNSYGHSKPLFRVAGDGLVHANPRFSQYNCVEFLARSLLLRPLWAFRDFAESLVCFFCSSPELDRTEQERVVAGLFKAIDALGREHHTPVLFLLLPDRNDFTSEDWIRNRSRLGLLRRLLQEGGHDFVDFQSAITRAKVNVYDIYLDPGHYTPPGQRLLADTLHQAIRERYPTIQ